MAGGSPTQERATDRQCGSCGGWFDARGIDAHEANCDGDASSSTDTESVDEDSSSATIFDPLAEQEQVEPTETETTMSETPDCPTCGTDEQVTTTDELQEALADRGRLTPGNLRKTRQNTHYCGGCNGVFDDE